MTCGERGCQDSRLIARLGYVQSLQCGFDLLLLVISNLTSFESKVCTEKKRRKSKKVPRNSFELRGVDQIPFNAGVMLARSPNVSQ